MRCVSFFGASFPDAVSSSVATRAGGCALPSLSSFTVLALFVAACCELALYFGAFGVFFVSAVFGAMIWAKSEKAVVDKLALRLCLR